MIDCKWTIGAVMTAGIAALCVVPFLVPYHYQDLLVFLVINVLLASSYRFLALTGEWSLIHMVIAGCGAYASALMTVELGVTFWVAMPLAGLMASAVAFVLSFPLFRMKLFYFLIGSFAAGEAIRLTWTVLETPFGGPQGIQPIPQPVLGEVAFWDPVNYYFLALSIVTISLVILYRLEHSRFGLTLHALHWSDALAESVGVAVWRHKMLAFVISAFFAAIAGVLTAHYVGTINPSQYAVGAMVTVLVWVIVGGIGTFYGPIVGVVALTLASEWLRVFEEYRLLLYGVLLIVFTLFLPGGLERAPKQIRELFLGWRDRPAAKPSPGGTRPGAGEQS